MIHAILRKSRFVNRFYLTQSNRMHLSKSPGKVHRRPPACGNRNQPFIFDEIPLHVLCWAQWQYLLDCDSDVARKRTVSRKYIAKEHWCLETLRNKRGSRMTLVNTSLVLIWISMRQWRGGRRVCAFGKGQAGRDEPQNGNFSSTWTSRLHARNHARVTQSTMIQIESKRENADISPSGDRNVIGSLHYWNNAAFGFKMTLHLLYWHLTESKPRNNGRSQVKDRKNLAMQVCSL